MVKFIVGVILGILLAGGLAYYLNNTASKQFINKYSNESILKSSNSEPIILAPGTSIKQAGSGAISESDNKYNFYDILTGKHTVNEKNAGVDVEDKVYYINAGVFTDDSMANDMKARIALLGIDSIVKAENSDGRIINRIIIGPFYNLDEANKILQKLANDKIQAQIESNVN